jgi:ubiquinone biosynthesis protein UbiJ
VTGNHADPANRGAAAAPDGAAAAFINHLLRGASWASAALRPHRGRTARFELAPIALALTVLDNGEVAPAAPDAVAATTVTLTPGLLLRLAARDESAWREAGVSGDSDFAATLQHLARNLHWDAEEDLSRLFGDIVAHRMVESARWFQRWGEQAVENTARSFAEYWTEEQPLIASAGDLQAFHRGVDRLRDDVARLEKRLERLSRTAR